MTLRLKGCRLSVAVQQVLFALFAARTVSGRQAAKVAGVHYNTACYFFKRVRRLQAEDVRREQAELVRDEQPTPEADDRKHAVQVDESYFGGKQPGKRGRGAAGKRIVAGAIQAGRLFAEMVKDVSGETLRAFVAKVARRGEKVTTDGWKGYKGLKSDGFAHSSVAHAKGEWKKGEGHTNGIENAWRQIKRQLFVNNGGELFAFPEFLGSAVWFFNHRGSPMHAMASLLRRAEAEDWAARLPRKFRNGFLTV